MFSTMLPASFSSSEEFVAIIMLPSTLVSNRIIFLPLFPSHISSFFTLLFIIMLFFSFFFFIIAAEAGCHFQMTLLGPCRLLFSIILFVVHCHSHYIGPCQSFFFIIAITVTDQITFFIHFSSLFSFSFSHFSFSFSPDGFSFWIIFLTLLHYYFHTYMSLILSEG